MRDSHSAAQQRRSARWFPILLMVLAFWDLRTDLLLLLDHFTFTTLMYAMRYHLLAFVVLLAAHRSGSVIISWLIVKH